MCVKHLYVETPGTSVMDPVPLTDDMGSGRTVAAASYPRATRFLIVGACSRRATAGTLAVCRTSTEGAAYFYAFAAGTSMASPHVAAEAALIKSYNPGLSVSGIRAKILSTTDDIGVKGRDIYSNYGRINVARALGLQ